MFYSGKIQKVSWILGETVNWTSIIDSRLYCSHGKATSISRNANNLFVSKLCWCKAQQYMQSLIRNIKTPIATKPEFVGNKFKFKLGKNSKTQRGTGYCWAWVKDSFKTNKWTMFLGTEATFPYCNWSIKMARIIGFGSTSVVNSWQVIPLNKQVGYSFK